MSRIVCLLSLLLVCCTRGPTREQALSALITQLLVPDMRELARETSALSSATRTLSPRDYPNTLNATRTSWLRAISAWERVHAFRIGPIVDNSGLLRTRFWPVREAYLQQLIREGEPLSEGSVERLGVDLRGMYALEWLLFGAPSEAVLGEESAAGERARSALRAFATNAQHYADDAAATLGDGKALAASLAPNAQESISKLVNHMVANVEVLVSSRLRHVLEMQTNGDVRASEVQGGLSGSSTRVARELLRATESLYLAPKADGLSALVRASAPRIDDELRARFAVAREQLERIDVSLERADHAQLEAASRALKELELTLKVDLVSALGVTLTFTAGDGD